MKNPSILEGFFYVVGMDIKKKISLKCPVIQGFRLLYHKIAPAALILDSIDKFLIMNPLQKMKLVNISAYQLVIGFFLLLSLTGLIFRLVTGGINP